MASPQPQQKHFVLVHGACHGAWCWYKLKPALEAAGHRVTALDLSAAGINMKNIRDVFTLYDYSLPLLEFMESGIPAPEKVILVGHSLGGLSLALAMDKFPEKVSVGIFVSAFMPDSLHRPSYVLDKYNERTPAESWLDTEFLPYSDGNTTSTSMLFGPKFLASKLYQNCSPEDLALGIMLVRTGSMFLEDLSTRSSNFSVQGYGSGKRVFVVCDEDIAIPVEFQQWMIKNNPVMEVKEIKGSDHMAMLSKPNELCNCLLNVAKEYP